MVAEAEVVCCQQSVPAVLDVPFIGRAASVHEDVQVVATTITPPGRLGQVCISGCVSTDLSSSSSSPALSWSIDVKSVVKVPHAATESAILQFVPCIRSGSFADIGPRRYMEDEHIRVDDLLTFLGSPFQFPTPSAFYGVFDGHGGPEAAAYIRTNARRLFFEDVKFPQSSEANNIFMEEVETTLRRAFLLADLALADDCNVSSSSGTTALAAFVFGRSLLVANAGDCRAVLCRKGEAIDMSQDHKPIYPSERRRVEELGGFVDDGYLNGVLSVSRALGDWDMKLPRGGSPSPLMAEPEFRQVVLTEDDEFLIIGCDGIWDVMSSQQAVSLVLRGLRRHDDPEQCARDLVMEALRRNTYDNLTVIVVCFSSLDYRESLPPRQRKQRCFSLSAEALCSLRNLLDGSATR